MGEKCKISIRNIRREANDELKNSLKKRKFLKMKKKNLKKKFKIIQIAILKLLMKK